MRLRDQRRPLTSMSLAGSAFPWHWALKDSVFGHFEQCRWNNSRQLAHKESPSRFKKSPQKTDLSFISVSNFSSIVRCLDTFFSILEFWLGVWAYVKVRLRRP